jgi:hypothetical protein
MVRVVGILCGSALAISSLIIALGIPEFLPGPAGAPEITTVLDDVETIAEVEAAVVVETSIEDSTLQSEATLPQTFATQTPSEQMAQPAPEIPPEQVPDPSPEHWYAFWSPFRSELAANGFVSQLQRNTGMDYRVVQLKPGVYEVAFAYEADADIATHLSAISAATGLDMPDG